jgi:hypothetical protein
VGGRPEAFEYDVVGTEVVVFHHGRRATTLRAQNAAEFLADLESADPQQLMARVTGN